jgi:hypothetical protein
LGIEATIPATAGDIRMAERLMVLPSRDMTRVRLVRVPDDMSEPEAYRYVTGLVAEVPRRPGEDWVEDVLDVLEDHGFESLGFVLGPTLD